MEGNDEGVLISTLHRLPQEKLVEPAERAAAQFVEFILRLYCKKGARPSSKQQKFNIIVACSRKTHNTCNQR